MFEMMSLKKKKVELKGQSLIWNVVDQFSGMIEQLERGVEDCKTEQAAIDAQMANLKARNSDLTNSIKSGTALSDKLSDLIS